MRVKYLHAALFFALLVFGFLSVNLLIAKSFSFNGLSRADNIDKSLESIYATKLRSNAEEAPNGEPHDGRITITYTVSSRGNLKSDVGLFGAFAAETFNDARGWKRAGVDFREIKSDGRFNLIISEAKYLPEFSPICSVNYSCRVGKNIIINDDRWTDATDLWNASGGSLRDYRHMVINHEVGHFLGHIDNDPICDGIGHKAPLMQQQSMNLRGCLFNPWPLDNELWVKI